MSKEEITRILQEFNEYLDVSNSLTDVFRYMAWAVVRGLAWITDSLEGITDNILLIKNFYQNEDIANFVEMIQPFLFILLAFSILYAGYMLIFQKKFNREGMIINIFIACCVILLLGAGMDKGVEFTDIAIDTIKTGDLYESEKDSKLSDTVIKQGITDLMMFDQNEWSTTELEEENRVPVNKIKFINPKERFTEKDTELKLNSTSKDISKSLLTSTGYDFTSTNFDQSGLEFNNEYYFRYSIKWTHIIITLGVISFTLLSISIKLARLSFELAFNYVLAIIIAPADVHNGQKTKAIVQSILNIFIVTILIFMSMKIYIIGMGYLDDNLEGVTYLIALIAFSIGVIDAPNIIERLFGIDGGLKSGWGMITGAYIGSKVIGGTVRGMSGVINKNGNRGSYNNTPRNPSGYKEGVNKDMPVGKYYNDKKEGNKNGNETTSQNMNKAVKNERDMNIQPESKSNANGSSNSSQQTERGNNATQSTINTSSNSDNAKPKNNSLNKQSLNKNTQNKGKTYKTTSLNDKQKKDLRNSNRKGD